LLIIVIAFVNLWIQFYRSGYEKSSLKIRRNPAFGANFFGQMLQKDLILENALSSLVGDLLLLLQS
jgi:hypothetical protein